MPFGNHGAFCPLGRSSDSPQGPTHPELSIVVPLLNEAATLDALMDNLARQQGCCIEVLCVDGGSSDGSWRRLRNLQARAPFKLRLLKTARGRARQMNFGAAQARGAYLLFLHADSLLPDVNALQRALAFLRVQEQRASNQRLLGARFALRFAGARQSFGYYFFECKARLDLPGCIHGDQGFLLSRRCFEQLGGFDESLSLLEDDRLVAALAARGAWLLLPAEIHTSVRRFETEGLMRRQLVNALIMNFHQIGWHAYFDQARALYRQQSETSVLEPLPFLQLVRQLLSGYSAARRRQLWLATGRYVRSQAWQPLFAGKCLLAYLQGRPPAGQGWGRRLCSGWERLSDHLPFNALTALLVWLWFHLSLWALGRLSRPQRPMVK